MRKRSKGSVISWSPFLMHGYHNPPSQCTRHWKILWIPPRHQVIVCPVAQLRPAGAACCAPTFLCELRASDEISGLGADLQKFCPQRSGPAHSAAPDHSATTD